MDETKMIPVPEHLHGATLKLLADSLRLISESPQVVLARRLGALLLELERLQGTNPRSHQATKPRRNGSTKPGRHEAAERGQDVGGGDGHN